VLTALLGCAVLLFYPRGRRSAVEGRYAAHGIDVSSYQGEIDWGKVAGDGISFAYIKASEGANRSDSRFADNWRQSKAAGIVRGAYHFFSLRGDGAAQAANFLRVASPDAGTLPPAIDLEFSGNSDLRPSRAAFQKELGRFCELIKRRYGVAPVLYTTYDFYAAYLKGFPPDRIWISDFVSWPHDFALSRWVLWQYYAGTGIAGIEGPVDRDVINTELDGSLLRK